MDGAKTRKRGRSRSGSNGSRSSGNKLKRSKVDKNPLLINACFHKNNRLVAQCLSEGANVNYIDPNTGYTPLLIAAETGNYELVKFLIERDANVNLQGFQGGPFPLDLARGKVKKLLLTRGAKGTVAEPEREKTPLVDVKEYSNPVTDKDPNSRFARLSIRIRNRANKHDEAAIKTLRGIIDMRREDPRQYDLEPFIDINQLNKYGRTLLEEACQRGKEEIVQLLIQAGVNVNLKGSDNYTPLGTAILYYNNNTQSLNIILELLKNGADSNMEYAKNQFPLITACYKGYIDVVELLLRFSRVNVNIKDNNGDTPLIAIIEEAGPDLPCDAAIQIIEMLIHMGADVNFQNSEGELPTDLALKNKSCPGLVTVLANYGAQFGMGPPRSRSR
jgi:ankyrin repeat protein